MNDTIVTVVGNVADSPRRNNTQGGPVTNFRLASTARRFDSTTQQFVDSTTFWVDVECWGNLSNNVSGSVSKGDPVVVHGTLYTDSWESESGPRSRTRIKAAAVGPNLARGMSVFKRDRSGRAPEPAVGVDAAASGELHPDTDEAPIGDYPTQDELRAGRDYVGEGEALDPTDDPDLSHEPAHA